MLSCFKEVNEMKILSHKDVKAKEAEKGASKLKVRWLITKETGAENFAMRLFEMKPKGYSPFHNHPWEHEVFILEGEGLIVSEQQERKFRTGDVIFIPPNERHQKKSNGEKIGKFLCVVPFHE